MSALCQEYQDSTELVVVSIEDKNWKGIFISLACIVVILAFIGFAIFLLTPPNELDNYGAYRIDLKELIQNVFHNKPFRVHWISANELLCHGPSEKITILQLRPHSNVTSKPLIHHSVINRFNIQKTSLSSDRQLILLESTTQSSYQYTVTCDYYIYNVSSEVVIGLKEDVLRKYFESRVKFNTTNLLEESRQLMNSINLQHASWCPNSTNLILIINNDLYFVDQLNTGQIDSLTMHRLTVDGSPSIIYNGISDWIYSKFFMNVNYQNSELNYELSLSSFWWSFDSRFLLYASFNDSLVNRNSINFYSDSTDYLSNNMPNVQQITYPLPGKSNPIVNLFIQKFNSSKPILERISVKLPIELLNLDYYLVNVQWTSQSDLILLFTLRTLNNSLIVRCTASSDFDACTTLIQLPVERGSFTMDDLTSSILHNANRFNRKSQNDIYFLRIPQKDAKQGLYTHVAGFNLKNSLLNYYTHGPFDVTKLLAFDHLTDSLYFQATKTDQLQSRHIYQLKLSANKRSSNYLNCITCDLHLTNESRLLRRMDEKEASMRKEDVDDSSKDKANFFSLNYFRPINVTIQNEQINDKITDLGKWILNCDNYDASFSPDFQHFVLICNGPNVPYLELWQNEPRKKKLTALYRDVQLEESLSNKRLPKEHYLTVPLKDENKQAYIRLTTPPPLSKQEKLEADDDELEIFYPMIVECISLDAFNATKITNRYQIGWPQYLASKRELIYAQIVLKNRERANWYKKKTFDHATLVNGRESVKQASVESRSLSSVFRDQLEIISYLVDNFSNIDRKRIMLIGKATESYTALGTLAEDKSNLISAAIAISPVVNWRLIDSITAEYNLGFPFIPENFAQFEKENLIYKKSALIQKKFLLIHGTADEKVPVQQTMQLVKSLVTDYEQNRDSMINYQIQLYPDESHELTNCKHHMYLLIENYIDKIFLKKD